MTLDPQTNGTTAGGTASASGTTAGVNAGQDDVAKLKEQVQKLTAMHNQHLAEKSNNEEVRNRLAETERELADLRRSATTASHPNNAAAALYARNVQIANDPDADPNDRAQAQLVVNLAQGVRTANQRAIDLEELLEVPETVRKKVREISEKEGVSIALAHKIHRGDQLEAAEKELAAREERLKALDTKRVVGTVDTTVGADTISKDTKTRAEFALHIRNLRSSGNDAEAERLLWQKEQGEIKLKP